MVVTLAVLTGVVVTLSLAYLLLHLVAALAPVRSARVSGDASNLLVLIPAHDEELTIGATLASLAAQDVAPGQVVVIADNCTDSTARIALEAGVTVWERLDPENRGKGYALAWAVDRALVESSATLFAVLDADTQADPGFCCTLSEALENADAVQGRYGVLSPDDGWRVALMSAAFSLVNHVRPLGADRLGSFVGLKGNGMGFTRDVLEKVRWRGDSVTEDLDFALDLALAGIRIRYAPAAIVSAQMPSGGEPAATQRRRWEGGRLRLLATRAVPLLRAKKLGAALELLVLPLSEQVAILAAFGALALATGASWIAVWWWMCVLALIAYVVGGLLASKVEARVWLALLRAPFYIVWKLALRLLGPWGQGEWVRTARKRGETAP